MKIYVAARARYRADEVKQIQEKLRATGHTITYDWASQDSLIRKPYREPANRLHNSANVPQFLKAAAEADIFILLDDPGMRGAYIELGAFLHNAVDNYANKKVFVVGPDSHKRESVFESPDYVYFVDTIEEVYSRLE